LYSETHTEGRIGYREWARRSGRLADIHSIDDRFDHHIDELMDQARISDLPSGAEDILSAPFTSASVRVGGSRFATYKAVGAGRGN